MQTGQAERQDGKNRTTNEEILVTNFVPPLQDARPLK